MADIVLNRLREIFNRHDPVGIYMSDDVNVDEYDPEIKDVQKTFHSTVEPKKFTKDVTQVFNKWFGKGLASDSAIENLAKDVHEYLLTVQTVHKAK